MALIHFMVNGIGDVYVHLVLFKDVSPVYDFFSGNLIHSV